MDTWFMVFSATFNNISVILWWSVLLVEETGVPGENHWSVANHWQTLSHIKLCRVHLIWTGFELTTLVVIGTDCVASYKSNYHMITATMTPIILASEKCQKSQFCKDPFSWSSRCSRVLKNIYDCRTIGPTLYQFLLDLLVFCRT